MKQDMKELIKEQGIIIPDAATDPQDRRFFELLTAAMQIAIDKEFPLLLLTASSTGVGLNAMMGSKKAIIYCLKSLLKSNPDMLGVVMAAVAEYMMSEKAKEKRIIAKAQEQTPGGN